MRLTAPRCWRLLAAWFVLGLLATGAGPARAQGERCFPETEQCIRGRIRTFWEQNGGLPVFGYPIAP